MFSDRFATFLAFFYSGSFVRIICINSIHNISKISRAIVDYQRDPTDAVFRYTRNRTPSCYACQRVGGESKTAFTIFQPKDGKPSGIEFAEGSIKAEFVTRLQVSDPGPVYIHFPGGEGGAEIEWSSLDCLQTFYCERRTGKTPEPKEKVEEKPRVPRCSQTPVVTYSKPRAEETGKVASGRSTWGS